MPPPQGNMVMHMRTPTSGPFPNPIQRPVMQVNKAVIMRSTPYTSPGRDPTHSTPPTNPEPPNKGAEEGTKVSHPLYKKNIGNFSSSTSFIFLILVYLYNQNIKHCSYETSLIIFKYYAQFCLDCQMFILKNKIKKLLLYYYII